MSDQLFWYILAAIVIALALAGLTFALKDEAKQIEDAKRALAELEERRKLQARYDILKIGYQHGPHEVVSHGLIDDGFYFLVKSTSDEFICYLLVTLKPGGLLTGYKSAYTLPSIAASSYLVLGQRDGAEIVYPDPPPEPAKPANWIDLALGSYTNRQTVDVLFELADKNVAAWAKVRSDAAKKAEDDRKRAKEEAEERERRTREEEYERLVTLEDWYSGGAKMHGALARWQNGSSEHRDRIKSTLSGMLEYCDKNHNILDFNAMPDDGRRMFLPVYAGIRVGGTFPVYDFAASKPLEDQHVFICRHGPADAVPWRERMAQINRYLGGKWSAQELDGTRILLSRLPEMPATIPFDRRVLRKRELFVGIDVTTAQPAYIPLDRMTHVLVCGQTGSGKSVGLNQLKRSLLFNIDQIAEIAACDLKGGVDLARFAGLSPKIRFIDDYAGMHELAESWCQTMKQRFAEMRAHGETNTTGQYRILIVDEFSEIGGYEPSKEEKPRHQKLLANLALLAQQGRAAGIRLILQTQAPTADYLPTNIAKNLGTVMCYRMTSRQNVGAVFAGHGDALPADPATFKAGEYLMANGATGDLVHLRTTACHDPDGEALKACLPKTIQTSR